MTIYIRPDGTISGSNEPLPVLLLWHYKWKETCINFEDQMEIRKLLPNDAWGRDPFDPEYNPDIIIENVEVETEVWTDTFNDRTVLRIKDKP